MLVVVELVVKLITAPALLVRVELVVVELVELLQPQQVELQILVAAVEAVVIMLVH